MADCVHTTLIIPLSCDEQAAEYIDADYDNRVVYTHHVDKVELVLYSYELVDHGALDFLLDLELIAIPYKTFWAAGNTFPAGERSVKYLPNGDKKVLEFDASDKAIHLNYLLRLIDEPEQLKSMILEKSESLKEYPWTDQEKNRKIFLTMQLIQA